MEVVAGVAAVQGGVATSGSARRARARSRRSAERRPLPARGVVEPAAAIQSLAGGLVSEYMGSAPTVRTYLNGDVLTVVVEDALTGGERRLVRDGMGELVLSTRRAFQQTMRADLMAGVEEITGRKVRLAASEMDPDLTVEVLVLADPGEASDVRRRAARTRAL